MYVHIIIKVSASTFLKIKNIKERKKEGKKERKKKKKKKERKKERKKESLAISQQTKDNKKLKGTGKRVW